MSWHTEPSPFASVYPAGHWHVAGDIVVTHSASAAHFTVQVPVVRIGSPPAPATSSPASPPAPASIVIGPPPLPPWAGSVPPAPESVVPPDPTSPEPPVPEP